MLSPVLGDVLLHCTAWRAVVIEASDAAVDLEGGNVKQPPLQGICLHDYEKLHKAGIK